MSRDHGGETETGERTAPDTGPEEPDPRDETTQVANEERRRKVSFISGIVAVLGLWVAVSVLLFDVGQATVVNNVLVGVAVLLAAGYNYRRLSNDVPLHVGVGSLLTILGVWLVVATLVFEMVGMVFWSTLASGLLIAGLAGYNAYEARAAEAAVTDGERDSAI